MFAKVLSTCYWVDEIVKVLRNTLLKDSSFSTSVGRIPAN